VGHLGGFEQVALLNQLQLIGDIVVYWTLPFVIRIAAAEAAPSLLLGCFTAKLAVDLPIVLNIDFDYGLAGSCQGTSRNCIGLGIQVTWETSQYMPLRDQSSKV
jgi:hypothetical protein